VTLRSIALSNLRRRRARTAFLVVGLLIGVATVVAVLTLARAMTGQSRTTMKSYGANIVVTPGEKGVTLSYGGMAVGDVAVGARSLHEADLARLETIPSRSSITIVAPELVDVARADGRRVLLMGVRPEEEFALKRWWSVATGRPPANGRELVAGSAVARALDLQMGDYVSVEGRRFTVTGLLAPTGSQDDNLLIAELGAVQRLLGRPGEVTLVQVAASYSGAPVERIVGELSAALPGATVTSLQEAVESRRHALDRFQAFATAIVGVVVAIELLVVFVTMMGSVAERTREIGVFRALGYRRAHIARLILFEALVASALAGVLGYLAGMATAYAALPLFAAGAAVQWVPGLAAAAVVLAVAVGAAASLYPALRAGNLDPTEALRAL
jgi:putative ABC transport system permease protein